MERPLPAFYSYSHKDGRDSRHLGELLDALSESRRDRLIDDWDDRRIRGGQQWEEVIIDRARRSRVFLLIVTNRFVASDFCVSVELTIARALYNSRAAAIAPILAEDANWKIAELRDLQVIMPFGKPVNESKRSKAWTAVGKAVRQIVADLIDGSYFGRVPANLPAIPPLLPFTIGRETETTHFENALRTATVNQPFICVITGKNQGQSEFIASLLIEDGPIRKRFGLSSADNPLAIPANVWVHSHESVESVMNLSLTSQVLPTPASADRAGIAASLGTHPGLSIINCELSAAEWRECGYARFQEFLSYWSSWPDLNTGRPMLVFVTIRAEVDDFEVPGGICLRLGSVTPEALETWLVKSDVSRRFIVERLRQHLDEVFGSQNGIPMEEFACRFLPLLRKFQLVQA